MEQLDTYSSCRSPPGRLFLICLCLFVQACHLEVPASSTHRRKDTFLEAKTQAQITSPNSNCCKHHLVQEHVGLVVVGGRWSFRFFRHFGRIHFGIEKRSHGTLSAPWFFVNRQRTDQLVLFRRWFWLLQTMAGANLIRISVLDLEEIRWFRSKN